MTQKLFFFFANDSAEYGHKALNWAPLSIVLLLYIHLRQLIYLCLEKVRFKVDPTVKIRSSPVRSRLEVRRSNCISVDSGLHLATMVLFPTLSQFGRMLLNVAEWCLSEPLDKASTSGPVRYIALEKVLTSGPIDE